MFLRFLIFFFSAALYRHGGVHDTRRFYVLHLIHKIGGYYDMAFYGWMEIPQLHVDEAQI
jgi:hypothetical protein